MDTPIVCEITTAPAIQKVTQKTVQKLADLGHEALMDWLDRHAPKEIMDFAIELNVLEYYLNQEALHPGFIYTDQSINETIVPFLNQLNELGGM